MDSDDAIFEAIQLLTKRAFHKTKLLYIIFIQRDCINYFPSTFRRSNRMESAANRVAVHRLML
jgi:hypothetical protein